MKKIFVLLFIITGSPQLFAQHDPDVTGSMVFGSVAPTGSPYLNGEAVSFNISAGSSIEDLDWPAPGGQPFVITINTTRIVNLSVSVSPGFTNYFAAPVITDLGGNSYTIVLTQMMTIPEGSYTEFLISGLATGPDGATIGYQANGNPGGYDNTGPGTDSPRFYGAITGALPVSLLDFNVKAEAKVAQLKWSTSEESNSDHFQVQHSLDAKNWVTKGVVNAAGDSKVVMNYGFSDAEVANGNNYYRLKAVDKDGSFNISKARSVFFEDIPEVSFELFPNPAVDKFMIKAPDWSKVRAVSISNSGGREVYRSAGKPNAEISVGNLPYGIYTVKIVYVNQTEVIKRLAIQN
ncbi:T9SS type A sorting domain-containing protein [Emticicia sp. CRIBPO]|uniref:T9SS type A sorting domain-containing protein n=1 Tax=Emticicia sp. CRIBPO TaxID=2683258 RepID=UPI0014123C03|nr:T9SS type A sorting domain-containing protein [Emticicia sp. CRIBPO]NBA84721.1 T9SS type A sorting domain-containing protein [Emticicia sp. CRIBPO]